MADEKIQKEINPASCSCEINVTGYKIVNKGNKPDYIVTHMIYLLVTHLLDLFD